MLTKQQMKRSIQLFLLVGVVAVLSPYLLNKLNFYPNSHAEDSSLSHTHRMQAPASYANAVEHAAPSVVSIQTKQEIPIDIHPMFQDPFFRFFFGEQGPMDQMPEGQIQQGLGSGVIIDKKGHILTNHHVIKDASVISVKLMDGRSSEAKLIGTDARTDLAILKLDLKDLPSIEIGESKTLRVGDVVLAIGNPFGLASTVTQGIVSAMGSVSERSSDHSTIGYLDNLIQTDAAVNPGNSGGALIDAEGRLIGINQAIITRSGGSQGIGFAIPIDIAKDIMQELIDTGHIVRGWLGAQLRDLSDEMRKYLEFKDQGGAYIQSTFRNSPAQHSGLLPGDIITKVDNTPIKNSQHAAQVISSLKPKKQTNFEIFRKGEYMSFSVRIAERPQNK